ncbi:MAG TPA: DJ-1/PfpI family protein [Acidimicrobiales bacterium]|nr:DJ-1/PfpI family protein [Acidimicrobiales bacterium]
MDIVMLLFDGITALDAIGPYEVLSRIPGARMRFVAERPGVVTTDNGALRLVADEAIAEVGEAEVLVVPGGQGSRALMYHEPVLSWIRDVDQTTSWTTSVCTGSLLLGGAGLLVGRRATTHWLAIDLLATTGAIVVDDERVVVDGKIVSAAGVSSGIDMTLWLTGEIAGHEAAQAIQLSIEYDPQPPFDSGSVAKAPPAIVEALRALAAQRPTSA